jgi:serine phosphatase RsbU (regulator of sigma subunit)
MSELEVQIAVAKIAKYAVSESGDTVEVVERPHGGLSVIVADGQRSGRSAKSISNLVARKAISLLGEGVRDGAVARATHDYLRTLRGGKVSAELSMVSVDLVSQTIVLSRNSRCPVLVRRGTEAEWLTETSEAVGIHPNTKPIITEMSIQPGLTLVVFTDGILRAGERFGQTLNVGEVVAAVDPQASADAQSVADRLLERSIALDQRRPQDDSTVLILKVIARRVADDVRRLAIRFPI